MPSINAEIVAFSAMATLSDNTAFVANSRLRASVRRSSLTLPNRPDIDTPLPGQASSASARAGRVASARATFARLSRDPLLSTSGEIATALDLLGEGDAAIAMLRRAVAQHDQRIMAGSRSEPYDRLRTDGRLAALFAEIESPH